MDHSDHSDEERDVVGGFDVGGLSQPQRDLLSAELTDAGILHAFVGAELHGPSAESDHIEHLISRVRTSRPRRVRPTGIDDAGSVRVERPRLPFGDVPPAAVGLRLAPRWRRFVAYLVEAIAFGLVSAIILNYSAGGAELFAFGIGLVSSVVLVALLGATLGMMVFRMRVARLDDPERLAVGWRVAALRYVVAWWPSMLGVFLALFVAVEDLTWLSVVAEIWLALCFGPILFDPARRGLHDRVTGTVVLDVSRGVLIDELDGVDGDGTGADGTGRGSDEG